MDSIDLGVGMIESHSNPIFLSILSLASTQYQDSLKPFIFESEGLNRLEGKTPPNSLNIELNNEVPLRWQPSTNHTSGLTLFLTFK